MRICEDRQVPGGVMEPQLLKEIQMLHDQVCYALGDPKRLMILYVLSNQPQSVNDIADELDIPQPTVSRHLKILRERALVKATRQGQSVYYALADDRLIQALELLRGILRDRILMQAQVVQADPKTDFS
ncbi:MAG: ArsR family transcriptional regulator [Chloroflexi bacterium]|nr:ArsR family transcriptional regulator [Chloroflexota bacterium]MDL1884971.1 winged helix-turn-helix transcriptional regulator [Anaerolineae bacterium CFX8]